MSTDEQFIMKVAYPLYYTDTQAESVANLVRLISGRLCGLDEGPEFYVQRLSELLGEPENESARVRLPDLRFSDAQVRSIMQGVVEELSRSMNR